MCIYVNNNHAKFHPDLIWNDRALGFLNCIPKQQQQQIQID